MRLISLVLVLTGLTGVALSAQSASMRRSNGHSWTQADSDGRTITVVVHEGAREGRDSTAVISLSNFGMKIDALPLAKVRSRLRNIANASVQDSLVHVGGLESPCCPVSSAALYRLRVSNL